jgi:hypothetical protein
MNLKNIFYCMVLFISLLNVSCSNYSHNSKITNDKKDSDKPAKTTRQSEEHRMQSYIPAKTFEITPLTYDNYISIINSDEAFSTLIIELEKETHDPFIKYSSIFSCKQLAGSNLYSDCNVFEGVLTSLKKPYGPDSDCYYEVEFEKEEMEEILAFIETNNEYFFNNEEFDGLDIPFIVQRYYIDYKYYNFSLYVHEPNPSMEENFRIKLINKYADELVPGTPLYGLFQLWGEQFLPELLQHKIECY